MDQVKWWADFVSGELEGTATVEYEALSSPEDGSVPARVTITPHRAGAMSLRVSAGGGDVSPVDLHPESKRLHSVASWLPYAESHEPSSLFRRSPDYDQLPSAAFVISAFPSWKARP
ncbi:hypothetical protein N1028_13900 [Herbiconiux sp. CPCC 203407]|uniref:Uncharacterized protein n=1 Tax=Herbiconiux oxytropis TaxID=2970915 RepID=A0AA41XIG3_9MICO|nr:hypothetical protein [Herbiconiux oxytropis]MCS5724077.1 hypothetical protein [Herbiconiux oxytropis]MCS5726990.1 hypothetical protein [Herbiconiux oxytropis]